MLLKNSNVSAFRKIIAVTALSASLFTLSSVAYSMQSAATTVTSLWAGDETLWYVGTQTDVGGCANGLMVMDTSLPNYKITYSLILSAYLTGRSVVFFYSDTCQYDGAHRVIKSVRLQ